MNNEDTDFTEPSDEGTAGTAREGVPTDRRPLGSWLRIVDGLITREFAAAFAGADIDRRDWMLLNALSGDVEMPSFAERFARKGKRLRNLEDRGWVEEKGDGTWALTDEGRAAKEQLGAVVDGIRSRVAGAVSPEDYATTMASLEAIARELGWEEGQRTPRRGFGRDFGAGFRPGFGPGFRGGFGPGFRGGPGFGPGFRPGFGPGHDEAHEGSAARRAALRPARRARLARARCSPPRPPRRSRTRRALGPVGPARVRARLRRRVLARTHGRHGGLAGRGLTPSDTGARSGNGSCPSACGPGS